MEFQSSKSLVDNDQHHVMFKIRKIGFPIVIVFCVVLLVVCIALSILYSQELNKSSEFPKLKYETCGEERCLKLGLAMVQKMNKSADPCQDFYAYACGGWQQRNPLKNNDSRINTGTIVMDENIEVLKTALDHAHLNYSMNDAVMKTARAYNSCMNTSAIDARGLEPLNKLIDEYGGWTLSSNYNSSVSIATRIAKTLRELNVESLFGVFVRVNPLNSDEHVLVFSRSSLGLPQQKYLNCDKDSGEKRQAYKKYMKAVSQMFNAPYEKMMAIYDIEVKLAKINSDKDPDAELMDYLKKIGKSRIRRSSSLGLIITLNKFCQQTGCSCSLLKEVLSITFAREFTGYERVLALPSIKRFFKTLYSFYIDNYDSLLADYIMWRVVNHYLEALPIKYRSAKDNFLERTASPRWEQCILRMIKAFDLSLGLLYVDVRFDDKTKIKINEMIESLRASFIERLPSQTWIESDTQEMAKKKAQAIIAKEIGYPRFIKNPEKLKEYYEKFKVTDDLFENYKAANHFIIMRNLKKFGISVDKNEWAFESPANYNAFYNPYLNRIVFLAGILQPPMYSPGYPRYLNYGGIGMVIGHEITHGFDGTGRLFDKDGNFNDWWSSSSEEIFEQKSKCFVAQYNKYRVFDKYINGTQTLNENIADNGGVQLAYDAYQRWTKKNGAEQILPGLDLNPDQLFFLGFAQSWCGIYSKKGAYKQLEVDSHSMGKYRVIGSLSNFEKFSKAFNCPTNSGMNPVNKCGIW